MTSIKLWGVKQNNLKNIDVKIPVHSFTVICGPSGSGKSSLAFETLYAEGQRRYIESLSNYTKQFLNKAPKPDIVGIENIPPSISIEQKNSVKSSRSNVGTATEVLDHLRLLYEKIGKAYCPDHRIALEKDNPVSAAKKIVSSFEGERGYVLVLVSEKKRILKDKLLLKHFLKEGFVRIYKPGRVSKVKTSGNSNFSVIKPGKTLELNSSEIKKNGLPKKDFYLVVDRLSFDKNNISRLVDSLSQAFKVSINLNKETYKAQCEVLTTSDKKMIIDERHSCSVCGYQLAEISSRLFSFNSPVGACSSCNGFGNILSVDQSKVIPDPSLTIAQGAIKPFYMPSGRKDKKELLAFCKKKKIDIHTPWIELSKKNQNLIWNGNKDFYGVLGLFEYLETKKYKMHVRVFLARHKSPVPCPDCKGSRLRPEALQVLIDNNSIADLTCKTISELRSYFEKLKLSKHELEICHEIHHQIKSRLKFLSDVGIGYLTLDRPSKTLSGGEYQRLNLANQLGMGLSQTLYVLDEPTVGLHPRDNDRLIEVLKSLNQLGNTLVVVEHDKDVIENSNYIIEIGPGSGYQGGEIIYSGYTEDFFKNANTATTKYLSPKQTIYSQLPKRPVNIKNYKYVLKIDGCRGNNLKNIDAHFPLNRLVTVTGVSGSGKSSLISGTLYPALAKELKQAYLKGHQYSSLTGFEHIKNLLFIDQSPVGKTERSNPVTYLKVYDAIRGIFSSTPEAKALGLTPGSFSLNVDGGRCPTCKGLGYELIDMMFMDDIQILCDTCDGKKFRDEVLGIRYKRKNIYDVLKLTVAEAMDFFVSYPNIRRPLSLLKEVGMDYITLGQSSRSLSGGESQRLKIAREFNSSNQKNTLFILDEPTTGLHFKEVELLMKTLNRLVEAGGSVILVEHNLEVIAQSDYILDIGPEAGSNGGKIVAQGSPYELIKNKKSLTGRYLDKYLNDFQINHRFNREDSVTL